MVRAGDVVTVTLRVPVPLSVHEDDCKEWVRFNLGKLCSIDGGNPLLDFEPEPTKCEVSFDVKNSL